LSVFYGKEKQETRGRPKRSERKRKKNLMGPRAEVKLNGQKIRGERKETRGGR